jgi:hypothetical protein
MVIFSSRWEYRQSVTHYWVQFFSIFIVNNSVSTQLKGVIQQDYKIIHPQLKQRVKGIRTLLEFFAYGEVLDASNSYLIAQPAKSLI